MISPCACKAGSDGQENISASTCFHTMTARPVTETESLKWCFYVRRPNSTYRTVPPTCGELAVMRDILRAELLNGPGIE